jgi:glycine/D-amino acid oxidase-like deaminating enzyme/nitrite reductase/ring-hydroxylating ferredoxin subunit
MTHPDFDSYPINNNSGHTTSLWMETRLPPFPSLEKNLSADVCIVGAGITGLTCAYTLAKQGKSVVVVDKGPIAGGQTARTTAHLSWALDDRYFTLESYFGLEGTRNAAESHCSAINYIEKIINDEEIECDFERVSGYLFVPPEESTDILDKEFLAINKTGMKIDKVSRAPFSSSFDAGPSLHFPRQAQFHPLKYLQGLIKAIQKYGGQIYSNTPVSQFEDGSPSYVKTTSGAIIESTSLIVATCTPVNNRYYIHTKQAAYRTYVIGAAVPKNSVPSGLYWDTADPYHYLRTQSHATDSKLDWLIIGGEDHKTGQDAAIDEKYQNLEDWAKERFPQMGPVEYKWSGQVFEPVDSLAFIGRNPGDQNTYIATGDSGNGITHGTIAGLLIPDLISGRVNPWESLYNPSRKTLKAAKAYIQENMNVLLQYSHWLTPGEITKVSEMLPEEGMLLKEGMKKIAVYKDSQNKIHMHSAVCTHLGGCVSWNPGERSWDCPCHGARYDALGKVLNGPAIHDLSPLCCDGAHFKQD